jgi:hypothetical protein
VEHIVTTFDQHEQDAPPPRPTRLTRAFSTSPCMYLVETTNPQARQEAHGGRAATGKMDPSACVGKLLEEDGDTLREGIRVLAQALVESEVSGLIGAERYERSGERSSYRKTATGCADGTRGWGRSSLRFRRSGRGAPSRRCSSRGGERSGRCRPWVQEAYRGPITGEHPYLWIDATYHKVRQEGRVQAMATVVAIGLTTEGDRQILGVDGLGEAPVLVENASVAPMLAGVDALSAAAALWPGLRRRTMRLPRATRLTSPPS